MIDTTVFSSGNITEVKNWLDTNANDIFDSIIVDGKYIKCYIGSAESIVINFDSIMEITIKLNNERNKTVQSYDRVVFQKAYKTDNGILLHAAGTYHCDVFATKAHEIGLIEQRYEEYYIGVVDAPNFTILSKPKEFEVTTLCPVPYTNITVSEDILIPIWSQLGVPGADAGIQIVQINDINYVYNGIIALKE